MKTIVCIFAHPDDEAFGPAGTIAKLAKENDVYILCATKGEAGLQNKKLEIKNQNDKAKIKKLGEIRADELRQSAKVLGVKGVYFLGFEDGTLCNNLYHKLTAKIKRKLLQLKPEIILTFEPKGISGHIDHITVSMVASFLFYKLLFIKEMWQHCLLKEYQYMVGQNYFIYFPPGYDRSDVDKTIDVSDVWETKVAAMYCHKTQLKDIKRILRSYAKRPKEENFLVVTK
ncbi:MAG: PIG-L family deacetylase [Candidatus Levybacteria bacterium]|nr:PIG-L family deacetylase [Candidatus Levybacteria bacterium]